MIVPIHMTPENYAKTFETLYSIYIAGVRYYELVRWNYFAYCRKIAALVFSSFTRIEFDVAYFPSAVKVSLHEDIISEIFFPEKKIVASFAYRNNIVKVQIKEDGPKYASLWYARLDGLYSGAGIRQLDDLLSLG